MAVWAFLGMELVFYILVNGPLALLVRSLPAAWFAPQRGIFRQMQWEGRLYRRLRLPVWKGWLPEAGWMTGFSRRHLPGRLTPAYADRFLAEIGMAEVGHFVMGLAGFASLALVALLPGFMAAFVVVACLHLLVQMAYVMIQRYNRPRFMKLKRQLEGRQGQPDTGCESEETTWQTTKL